MIKYPGITIELKVIKKNISDEKIDFGLGDKADEVLRQIEKKQYTFSSRAA